MSDMKVPIEVSARHVHLCQEHIDILFGEDYQLTNKKELSIKDFFVTNETVEVFGSKGSAKFGILVPKRKKTQVELSITDAIKLGIDVVIRESGDLANSAGCTIKGPNGSVVLTEGVIVAARHLHLNDEMAAGFGIKSGDIVKVRTEGPRSVVFENVLVRTDDLFTTPSMHIDTDEGNAANISSREKTFGTIIK